MGGLLQGIAIISKLVVTPPCTPDAAIGPAGWPVEGTKECAWPRETYQGMDGEIWMGTGRKGRGFARASSPE